VRIEFLAAQRDKKIAGFERPRIGANGLDCPRGIAAQQPAACPFRNGAECYRFHVLL
jgi:hypothetical protein